MIIDIIASSFLIFNREFIIMPLIGLGYWAYKRDLFCHVFFLVLLSMIINTSLKCFFQVPLKPHLNQHGWYAFPSGHMQLATVLYGRLWWEFRKTQWAQVLWILLIGMGWGMIQKNYHDLADVAAGAVTGVGLLLSYAFFIKLPFVRRHPEKIGFFLFPVTSLLIFLMPSSIPQHLSHVWNAQGGLLGFSLGMMLAKRYSFSPREDLSLKKRALQSFVGIAGFIAFSVFAKAIFSSLPYPWPHFLIFFMGGIWMGVMPGILVTSFEKK